MSRVESQAAKPESPATAIEVTGLRKSYGDRPAVDGISFSVAPGEILGLLGPNGAGKSTTIRMLTTLLPPSGGRARVAGRDVVADPRGVRRRIGYVPQMLSADGNLTARENLLLSARLYGIPGGEQDGRIEEALRFMGLAEASERMVRTFSGGMIRRLELAQAMLHRPQVLFLDEPTIGLDPVARQAVWERLQQLRRERGTALLITTHDMEEADRLCDRIAILHLGRIAAIDRPERLKEQVGPEAGLNEVFARFSGGSITEEGHYRDVRQTRITATRLN